MSDLAHHRAGADALVEARMFVALAALAGQSVRTRTMVIDTETVGTFVGKDGPDPLVVEFGWALVEPGGLISSQGSFLVTWPEKVLAPYREHPDAGWITEQDVGLSWEMFVERKPGDNIRALRDIRYRLMDAPRWTAYNVEFDHGALANSWPTAKIDDPAFCMMRDVAHPSLAKHRPDALRWRKYVDRHPETVQEHVEATLWPSAQVTKKALADLGHPIEGWTR